MSNRLLQITSSWSSSQDLDICCRSVMLVCLNITKAFNNLHPSTDTTKNCVLSIKRWAWCQGYEKLRTAK